MSSLSSTQLSIFEGCDYSLPDIDDDISCAPISIISFSSPSENLMEYESKLTPEEQMELVEMFSTEDEAEEPSATNEASLEPHHQINDFPTTDASDSMPNSSSSIETITSTPMDHSIPLSTNMIGTTQPTELLSMTPLSTKKTISLRPLHGGILTKEFQQSLSFFKVPLDAIIIQLEDGSKGFKKDWVSSEMLPAIWSRINRLYSHWGIPANDSEFHAMIPTETSMEGIKEMKACTTFSTLDHPTSVLNFDDLRSLIATFSESQETELKLNVTFTNELQDAVCRDIGGTVLRVNASIVPPTNGAGLDDEPLFLPLNENELLYTVPTGQGLFESTSDPMELIHAKIHSREDKNEESSSPDKKPRLDTHRNEHDFQTNPKPRFSPSKANRTYIGDEDVTDSDLLCGREYRGTVHPANVRFRIIIQANRPLYLSLGSQHGRKTKLSKDIMNEAIEGRFLRPVAGENDRYFLLTEEEARAKVSQALREQRN